MDHTVGYVLLGSASVPAVLGWSLSLKGLSQAETAARSVKHAAQTVIEHSMASQQVAADASGPEATAVAKANQDVAAKVATLGDAVSSVDDALKGLTGRLAPARVAFALATLLVVAALFALGLISASAGSAAGTTTTTTTPTAP